MMRDVTLGQYFPGKSILHRLDPRMKIVLLVAFIVLIFCTGNYFSLAFTAVIVALTVLLSGVPTKMYLKSVKTIVFIVIFTSVLNLLYGTGDVLWSWGFLKITTGGIRNAVFVTMRIISLILVSSGLTFTTSPTDLTDALERLLKPLGFFKIRVHEIAMMMTIALRFIPTLLEETDKIMKAQQARGADFESGNIFHRAKQLIPILVPLFISAFRIAQDMAMAMEARCYNGGDKRTRMTSMKYKKADAVAGILIAAFMAMSIAVRVFL